MRLLQFVKNFDTRRHPRAPRGDRGRYAGGRFVPVVLGHPRLPFGPKNPAYNPAQAGATAANFEEVNLGGDMDYLWARELHTTYQSKNHPQLAAREMIQNSVDAIREAQRLGKLHRLGGHIDVDLDNATQSIRVQDNGLGMTWDVLKNKFLWLGASGKRDEGSFGGGFGMAKAVILGSSKTFDWSIHTLDHVFHSHQLGKKDIDSSEYLAPLVSGTDIVVRNIGNWDCDDNGAYAGHNSTEKFVREVLAVSVPEVPGIRILLDGQQIPSMFAGRRSVRLTALEGDWGQGNSVEIRSYKRASGGPAKIYVRVNGLYQWSRELDTDTLPKDILIDVTAESKPGDADYPFTTGRDGFRGRAYYSYYGLIKYLQRETHSGDREMGWDDTYLTGKGGAVGDFSTPRDMPGGLDISGHVRGFSVEQEKRNQEIASGAAFQKALAPFQAKIDPIKKAAPYEDAGLPMLVRKNRKTYGNRKKFDPMDHVETYAAWNAVTHMVATAYGMPRIALANFGSAFMLDPNIVASAQNDPLTGHQYLAINPESLEESVKKYRKSGKLWGITNHLYTMACHELAHLQHMDGHSESFTVHREAISLETGHILPAIHQVVQTLWGGPVRQDIKSGKTNDPAYQKVLEAAKTRAAAVHARQRVLKELTKRFGLPDVETLIERAQTDKRRLARMTPEDIREHIEGRMG